MKKAFSTNTTLTIQVSEGCTIPTSGGVSSVDYSTQAVPYGFPRDKGRWDLEGQNRADNTSPANSTYNHNITLTLPVGSWDLGYEYRLFLTNTVQAPNAQLGISTSSSSFSHKEFVSKLEHSTTNTSISSVMARKNPVTLTTATPYYTVSISGNAGTSQNLRDSTDGTASIMRASNALL